MLMNWFYKKFLTLSSRCCTRSLEELALRNKLVLKIAVWVVQFVYLLV